MSVNNLQSDTACCLAGISSNNDTENPLTKRKFAYHTSLQRMLARLPLQTVMGINNPVEEIRPLQALTTRDKDDPIIALLDSWATSLEVLSFYQQRYYQELYFKTATERFSISELARSVSYEMKPGNASSTYLAFTIDKAANGDTGIVKIPQGMQVQNEAVQDALPQIFETSSSLTANAQWNVLKPHLPQIADLQVFSTSTKTIKLKGSNLNLQIGDGILLIANLTSSNTTATKEFHELIKVTVDYENNYTTVDLDIAIVNTNVAASFNIYVFRHRSGCFGSDGPNSKLIYPVDKFATWDATPTLSGTPQTVTSWTANTNVTIWKKSDGTNNYTKADFYLSEEVSDITTGTWVYLKNGDQKEFHSVSKVVTDSLADFGVSAKVTGLKLESSLVKSNNYKFRTTTIYAKSEKLELYQGTKTDTTGIAADRVKLNTLVSGLTKDQLVIISDGKLSEVAKIASTAGTDLTTITFAADIKTYQASAMTIYGNVVQATHGETLTEVLGSGDGSQINQHFTLKKSPLTYTLGGKTSLQVRVNDVLWKEVPYLYDEKHNSQVYMVRQHDDKIVITFGDGIQGARLPDGQENIIATYRVGIGTVGDVAANSITLLQDRPLGVESVTNPIAATGSSQAETLETARNDAPLTTSTLQRLISLRDFEDYARVFPGLSKAEAKLIPNAGQETLYLTIAGETDTTVSIDTINALKKAMEPIRNSGQAIKVLSYNKLYFNVDATLYYDEKYNANTLKTQVETAIKQTFSFSKRGFAQNVTASEIITVMQNVKGVIGVDLNKLYDTTAETIPSTSTSIYKALITAKPTDIDYSAQTFTVDAAQLLMVNKNGIILTFKKGTSL